MYITQTLRRAVQVNSDGLATVMGNRQHTWTKFAERVAKLAGAFRKLGLEPDSRIAILSLNSDRYLECFFAVPWAGGIITPLNTRLALPELIYMLNDSKSEILVIDDAFRSVVSNVKESVPTIQHIVFADDSAPPEGTLSYEDILDDADPIPDTLRGGDDVAGIFYTGGTTGRSKGVMLTHDNMLSNTMNGLAGVYKGEHWMYLHIAPMFHIADCSLNCIVTTIAGTHVIVPKFDIEETLRTIQQNDVTACLMVPTMIKMLIDFPDIRSYSLSSLKTIWYGASPMPRATMARAMDVFPNCEFYQGYGMTETAAAFTTLDWKYHKLEGPFADKIESAGQANFGYEVQVVDLDNVELPRGVVGEIITRGPHVMKGYWNRPEETSEALRGGWMHTGDLGYMDDDGFVYVVDRMKDMIITGGENVYSAEVESIIYLHPQVNMCAVIGIPDDKWGESVHAVVVPHQGHDVTEEEIIMHCKEHIAGYKSPSSVEIRREPLPISGAGKILKSRLRAMYRADKSPRDSDSH